MGIHYKAGEDVPRYWFSKLENLVSMKFGCDCEMQLQGGERLVRRTSIEGDSMVIMEGNGQALVAEAKHTPILWINHDGDGIWEDM